MDWHLGDGVVFHISNLMKFISKEIAFAVGSYIYLDIIEFLIDTI